MIRIFSMDLVIFWPSLWFNRKRKGESEHEDGIVFVCLFVRFSLIEFACEITDFFLDFSFRNEPVFWENKNLEKIPGFFKV